MIEPDYREMISDLMGWGSMSQAEIGEAIGIKQASVSQIQNGVTKDPRASVAFKLLALHSRKKAEVRKRINAA